MSSNGLQIDLGRLLHSLRQYPEGGPKLVGKQREYKKLYDNLRINNWQVDVKNTEYFVEKLNNSSYIDYTDYKQWDILRNLIVNI